MGYVRGVSESWGMVAEFQIISRNLSIPPPVSEGIRRMMTTLTMLSEQAGPGLIGPQMDGIPADIRGLIPEEIQN